MTAALIVIAAGIVTGLLAIYQAGASLSQLILASFAGLTLMIAAIIGASLHPFRRHRDDDTGDDAEEHLKPLRQAGDAEKTLERDLHWMVLRPRGLTEARAAQLARKVVRRTMRNRLASQSRGRHARPADPRHDAQTVTLPAVPHDPTEPVLIVQPDPVFSWTTGEFEFDIERLEADLQGGAA